MANHTREHMRYMAQCNAKRMHLEAVERRHNELNQWISEQHKCEKCGKIMTEKFGSGRFCCKSCANSRVRSDTVKQKISEGVLNSELFLKSILNPRKHNLVRTGRYKNIYCGSTWELAYLIYCLDHDINIERCKKFFNYYYNHKQHKYLPDWYLPDIDTYVEIKGKNQFYNANVINAKAKALLDNKINYLYIDDNDIIFYIRYCQNKYNVSNLKYLYDDVIPK